MMASMSAGMPFQWTTMIARVRSVILDSRSAGSRVMVSGSMSAKTGTAPQPMMGRQPKGWTPDWQITSSPGTTPTPKRAERRAAVPLEWARAWRTPQVSATRSSSSVIGPRLRVGAGEGVVADQARRRLGLFLGVDGPLDVRTPGRW